MLSELCAACLGKYVRPVLRRSGRWGDKARCHSMKLGNFVHKHYLTLALPSVIAHNYRDIDGEGFTPTRAPAASLERPGCHPSAPRGCYRSSLSRQHVLRSKRPDAGQVRDAAQRAEGGACGSGGGSSLWPVSSGLLCHSGVIPARGPAGAVAAQARAKAAPQAHRRSDGCPAPSYPRSRTDAQGRGIGSASSAALWHRGPSSQYPAAAATGGKKRR